MIRVLVFGARGWLGSRIVSDLARVPGLDVTAAPWWERIDQLDDLAGVWRRRPDVVINAAGRTGTPNVDWCDAHPAETYRDNTVGPIVLADACERAGARLIHLSSGCIFFRGSAEPNPKNVYTRSKYAAELALEGRAAIVRIRTPFDDKSHPRNLLTKMRGYDQVLEGSPYSATYVPDMIDGLAALCHPGVFEPRIYHFVQPGVLANAQVKCAVSGWVGWRLRREVPGVGARSFAVLRPDWPPGDPRVHATEALEHAAHACGYTERP